MHPILFKIPLPHWTLPKIGELHAFPIYAYGVMLGLSLVIGWYITLGIAKSDGLPRETMANNYVFTAICAIVGSRVLYILTNLNEFHTWKDYLAIRSGGLVAYGGFIGGYLGSWYFCAKRKVRLMAWADAAVPSLASGLLFTRIGCYLFGCDFGKKLPESIVKSQGFFAKMLVKLGTFPEWHYDHKQSKFLDSEGLRAVYQAATDPNNRPQILSGSPAWVQHTETDPIVRDLHHSLPVHPTQIYESLCGLLLLATLWYARKSIKKREAAGEPFFRGELCMVFFFGYGVLRFLLEIVRDDAERGTYGMFMDPHVAYPIALMLMALSFWFGLSHIIPEKYRVYTQGAAVLVPFVVFMIMRPANKFELVEKVQFSTSQWIALLTGIAAALYYRRGMDLAAADPVVAADLGAGVPDLLEAEAAAERGEKPGDDEEEEDEDEGEKKPAAKSSEKKDDKKPADKKAEEKKKVEAKKPSKDDEDDDEIVEPSKTNPERPSAKVKAEEKKPEDKKSEAKDDDKKKAEAKKDEPKAEAKKDEPKAESKKDEPKAEAKKDEPKAEAKKDEPKAEAKDEKKSDPEKDEEKKEASP